MASQPVYVDPIALDWSGRAEEQKRLITGTLYGLALSLPLWALIVWAVEAALAR